MGELPLPLSEVFTAPGAAVWGAALAGIVELVKRAVPAMPTSGRGVLYLVMALAAGLVGLAAWDVGVTAITGATIVGWVLTWAAVVTAASGSFEIASKTGRVLQGTTDPTGPDEPANIEGPVSG